jgi:hypothetical protein
MPHLLEIFVFCPDLFVRLEFFHSHYPTYQHFPQLPQEVIFKNHYYSVLLTTKHYWVEDKAQAVEYLLCKFQALSSAPVPTQQKHYQEYI